MTTIKNAVAGEGRRYTFKVKRYSLPVHLGWSAVRMWGRIWNLPPGLTRHLEVEYIDRIFRDGDSSQLRNFISVCALRPTGQSTDATKPGVYWDGANLFHVGQKCSKPRVTEVYVETAKQRFIGIEIALEKDGQEFCYQLLTDKDVDIRTFYKYLLFQKHRISVRGVTGAFGHFASLRFGRDKRLEDECITTKLDGSLLHSPQQQRQKITA
ncbi:hypothetical protein HOV30_gp098 [Erwinia phage Derbicus]|uniref:Uncharacterized protein n=2 Tax=Derbicusvirus derbicus TaxID=2734104 RepID=A0A482IKW2_9CAUD|nr:hypothetical protein BIZ82_gp098 [Erwinia phage vB_EamM_EarlPhillipIV]YP_009821142.1 hypothetical protein HOV30_gp098 [Erwinia phage Derbicus]ANZ48947.1 hypothetical protein EARLPHILLIPIV_98 [Erwinia phage vB_EamM_EarlPhillipIV]QBP07524.1 hypothetical protein DERBICUS_98 [Erwinia phage Derbicus]